MSVHLLTLLGAIEGSAALTLALALLLEHADKCCDCKFLGNKTWETLGPHAGRGAETKSPRTFIQS